MPPSASWTLRLEPDHDRTLTHLVTGLTDRASAHRMGVSERTVQRRIRELMRWSASANRMQLGRNAALADLVDVAAVTTVTSAVPSAVTSTVTAAVTSTVTAVGTLGTVGALRTADTPGTAGTVGTLEVCYGPRFGTEPPPTPDAEDLHLLHLLLADAAAARLLNVSPRSIERRVRDLMTLAGARSRAQLGWLATRQGWI